MKYMADGYIAKIIALPENHRRVKHPTFRDAIFDTFEDARMHLAARYVKEIDDAQKVIASARRTLSKIDVMKELRPTK